MAPRPQRARVRFRLDAPPGSRTRRVPVASRPQPHPSPPAPAPGRRRRRALAAAAVMLVAAAATLVVLRATGADGPPAAKLPAVAGVLANLPQGGSVLGRADAPATLELFLDLRCEACVDFGAVALPRLIKDRVRRGRLRILLRPVIAEGLASEHAARLAYALAREDRLWPFVLELLAAERSRDASESADALLRRVAASVAPAGVDRAMRARYAPATSAALRRAQRRALDHGVANTPGFLLGATGGPARPEAAGSLATAIDRIAKDALPGPPAPRLRFSRLSRKGFRAQVPAGRGWSRPATTQPVGGRLFRTTVRGPGGAFVLVDFTPRDKPAFGGRFTRRRRVRQRAFGSAVRYVLRGTFAGCRRWRCIDHQVDVRGTRGGLAVLAGGPRFALTRRLAAEVTASLRPPHRQ
jgi:protein-disulfide isomerase